MKGKRSFWKWIIDIKQIQEELMDRTKDKFSAYLSRAVKNTTITYMESKKKIRNHEIILKEELLESEDLFADGTEEKDCDYCGTIEVDKLFAQITDKMLMEVLNNLSILSREVLCLRILYQKSFEEIGMIKGISGKKAENTYFNAIKKIRKILGEK